MSSSLLQSHFQLFHNYLKKIQVFALRLSVTLSIWFYHLCAVCHSFNAAWQLSAHPQITNAIKLPPTRALKSPLATEKRTGYLTSAPISSHFTDTHTCNLCYAAVTHYNSEAYY